MIWITYCNRADQRRALARREHALSRGKHTRMDQLRSKQDLYKILNVLNMEGEQISSWYHYGDGGIYGPELGGRTWPESLSPWEWRLLPILFGKGARAFFHFPQARVWFAAFFASVFHIPVEVSGPFWGSKSSQEFQPTTTSTSTRSGYDGVAALYDQTFADIRVREREWEWIYAKLKGQRNSRVLDIGCGNGALLGQLASSIAKGQGVDISVPLVKRAKKRWGKMTNLSFMVVKGPLLPFPPNSFDFVLSFFSFRYLDWDPILAEIKRVLAPGGSFLMVDMVSGLLRPALLPLVLRDKLRGLLQRRKYVLFHQNLRQLIAHPQWQTMLRHHPIRSYTEYKRYLLSRFPKRSLKILNLGLKAGTIAFDSGAIKIQEVKSHGR